MVGSAAFANPIANRHSGKCSHGDISANVLALEPVVIEIEAGVSSAEEEEQ